MKSYWLRGRLYRKIDGHYWSLTIVVSAPNFAGADTLVAQINNVLQLFGVNYLADSIHKEEVNVPTAGTRLDLRPNFSEAIVQTSDPDINEGFLGFIRGLK